MGYESPWDFNATFPVGYYHLSLLTNIGIWVRITPYLGLAYYDGADDGTYNTPGGTSYNLAGGAYPNLYSGGQEYGNYITANPIVISGIFGTHEVFIHATFTTGDHCPATPLTPYQFNSCGLFFDITGNPFPNENATIQPYDQTPVIGTTPPLGVVTPAPPFATPQEEQLLRDYGKVMYYKVEFGPSATTYTASVYTIAIETLDLTDPSWDLTVITTDFLGGDLLHNTGSSEIVVDAVKLFGTNLYVRRQWSFFNVGYGQMEIQTWYDLAPPYRIVWLNIL